LYLKIALVQHGFGLKDASAYNIQFRAGHPVFIDIGSIEKPERLDLWHALGQFQRMFLFPLLLLVKRGIDFRSYFLSSLDGWSPEKVARSFPGSAAWNPSLLLDVTLPAMLEKRASSKASSRKNLRPGRPEAQLINLRRLRKKILGLAAGYKVSSAWASYTQICNYGSESEKFKKGALREFLAKNKPARVLDLGCNTGDYSAIASECGLEVIAADGDHDAIEVLYRKVRQIISRINPIILDIANPSPAIGYLNRERSSFLERGEADCVLALALIHHLVVSANFPLAYVAELFTNLAKQSLVLEFVPREDEMFQRLLKFRRDIYQDYSLESCLAAFSKSFRLIAQQPITGSKRTLLFLQRV
jgi:SAM-dependent methyltransferase